MLLHARVSCLIFGAMCWTLLQWTYVSPLPRRLVHGKVLTRGPPGADGVGGPAYVSLSVCAASLCRIPPEQRGPVTNSPMYANQAEPRRIYEYHHTNNLLRPAPTK